MPTIIKHKTSLNTAVPSSLANGELAWTSNGDILYTGANGVILAIGGKRTPGVLAANQAIVTNATSFVDALKTARLDIGPAFVTSINAVANSTVLGSASNAEFTTTWGIKTYVDLKVAGVSGSPGGANTGIQFNDSGIFSSTTGFVFDKTTNNVSVANTVIIGNFTANTLLANAAALNVVGRTNTATLFVATSANIGTATVANLTGIYTSGVINAASFLSGTSVVNSTAVVVAGGPTINATTVSTTDLNVSGNLTISGTLTTIDTTNLNVTDSIIKLARQNAANILDLGFFGQYNDGTQRFAGLVYDASSGRYELFANTTEEPTGTVNVAGVGYAIGTLRSYILSGALTSNATVLNITANSTVSSALIANTLSLTTALPATSGGTGINNPVLGDLLVGGAGSTWTKLAVSATSGQLLQSNGTSVVFGDVDGGTF